MSDMTFVGLDLSAVNSGGVRLHPNGEIVYRAFTADKKLAPWPRMVNYVQAVEAFIIDCPGPACVAIEDNPFGRSTSGAFAGEFVGAVKWAIRHQVACLVNVNSARWQSYYGLRGRLTSGEKRERYFMMLASTLPALARQFPGDLNRRQQEDVTAAGLLAAFIRDVYYGEPRGFGAGAVARVTAMRDDWKSWLIGRPPNA